MRRLTVTLSILGGIVLLLILAGTLLRMRTAGLHFFHALGAFLADTF